MVESLAIGGVVVHGSSSEEGWGIGCVRGVVGWVGGDVGAGGNSYEVFHTGPPVIRLNELDGFGDSRVASSYQRVKMVKHTPPKIIVFHNNEGRVLP